MQIRLYNIMIGVNCLTIMSKKKLLRLSKFRIIFVVLLHTIFYKMIMMIKRMKRFQVFLKTFHIDAKNLFNRLHREETSDAHLKSAEAILSSRGRINRVCLRSSGNVV